ncbi:CueP family metal-binding protein [Bacillus sp. FJAT-50079]|uniref:CueP family metal-binding protein n=1 Tax=Bacillus sp. FJAT-50079 TaxID=2833577 RepID=UPI002015EC81|nr:CueP family metal-binding protein [Bacillus sp. FJAT-50079]
MKKGLLAFSGLLLAIMLAACSNSSTPNEKAVQDIKELVHDYSVGSFDNVTASITSAELIVTDKGKKTSFDLPEEEFFVSIAPFEKETHPCAIHNLTGCQGELVEKEFHVYIQDEEGNIVVDETMKSLENGFIDLWLPRDQTFQVKIKHDGKTAVSEISTFEGDNTCVTTMQLI